METEEKIKELALRYITAHTKLPPGERSPEFTFEELEPLRDYVRDRIDSLILHAYETTVREYAKGFRCAVCGRTTKQNAAIGYDCTYEC